MRIVLHTALSISLYKMSRKEQKSEFWAPRAPNSLLFLCAVKRFQLYGDSEARLFPPWGAPCPPPMHSLAARSPVANSCSQPGTRAHLAPLFFDRVAYVRAILGSSSTRKLKELQDTP